MANNKKLWVEKYRPATIGEYVFHDPMQKESIEEMIKSQTIPHLLLSGVQGSGKTTLARILISELHIDDTDVLEINASDERGIDVFREIIKNFCNAAPMGEFKIVHLEEADALTPQAQRALKSYMEEVSDYVRFIMTCNTVSKIIPPIRSRCQEFFFKASDPNDVAEYVVTILAAEKIKFDLDTVDEYINIAHPDVRKVVNMIQQNSRGGVLHRPHTSDAGGDYQFKLIELIEADDWVAARKLLCSSVTADDWESVYRFLYENINKSPKYSNKDAWETAIVTIAEHLYKHTIVADPEINAAAMLIKLSQ